MSARLKFLVGSYQHVFCQYYYIRLYYYQKGDISNSTLEKMTNIIRKLIKKLDTRPLNGHPDFSSGFEVIGPSNYEKMLKFPQNPGHLYSIKI